MRPTARAAPPRRKDRNRRIERHKIQIMDLEVNTEELKKQIKAQEDLIVRLQEENTSLKVQNQKYASYKAHFDVMEEKYPDYTVEKIIDKFE